MVHKASPLTLVFLIGSLGCCKSTRITFTTPKRNSMRVLKCRDCILSNFYADEITLISEGAHNVYSSLARTKFMYHANIPDDFSATILRDVCKGTDSCDSISFPEPAQIGVQSVTNMAPSTHTSTAQCIAVDYRYLTEVTTCQECLSNHGSYMKKYWVIIETVYHWMFWYYSSGQHLLRCTQKCGGMKILSRAYCEPHMIDLNELAEKQPYNKVRVAFSKTNRAKCIQSLAEATNILTRLGHSDSGEEDSSALIFIGSGTIPINNLSGCRTLESIETAHDHTEMEPGPHPFIMSYPGINVEPSQCLHVIRPQSPWLSPKSDFTTFRVEDIENAECENCIRTLEPGYPISGVRLTTYMSSFLFLQSAPHRFYIADNCKKCLSITVFPNSFCGQPETSKDPPTPQEYLVVTIHQTEFDYMFDHIVAHVAFHTTVYLVDMNSRWILTSAGSRQTIATICASAARSVGYPDVCVYGTVQANRLQPMAFSLIPQLFGLSQAIDLNLAIID